MIIVVLLCISLANFDFLKLTSEGWFGNFFFFFLSLVQSQTCGKSVWTIPTEFLIIYEVWTFYRKVVSVSHMRVEHAYPIYFLRLISCWCAVSMSALLYPCIINNSKSSVTTSGQSKIWSSSYHIQQHSQIF